MVLNKNIDKLITEALAIEARAAKESGALGYMGRALVQATMPHRKIQENEFVRRNGAFTLTMLAPSHIGLPYGSIPRLLIAWITTEAVKTQQPELVLGNSLSEFMRQLDLIPTGGRWGSITRLREQMKRLFTASISCSYNQTNKVTGLNMQVAEEYNLWWTPKQPEQATLWESTLILNKRFFKEIINTPVPIDLRALKALKRSPMALDIYCWLTYRMSYLEKKVEIPWAALQIQFGSDYKRTRDFKRYFINQMKSVQVVYSQVSLDANDSGLILRPSKTHISTP